MLILINLESTEEYKNFPEAYDTGNIFKHRLPVIFDLWKMTSGVVGATLDIRLFLIMIKNLVCIR